MPKTRISKEDTINICHYFAYLKSTYSVSLTQLAEICPLEAKTIARYTSSNIAPNHALTENTLKNLVAAFKIIFEQENIPIPHELSREFLLSNQLQEFLDTLNSQTSTSDVNDDAAITTANKTMIQCDPKKNQTFIFSMFLIGVFIFVVSCLEKDFFPRVFSPSLFLAGFACIITSITYALPYLKQPIEVRPELRSRKTLLFFLSNIMTGAIFVFNVARYLRYPTYLFWGIIFFIEWFL